MSDAPQILSPENHRLLGAVLDEIVPPGPRGLPGAGGLGLAAYVEEQMQASPDLRPAVEQGLAALARRVAEREGGAPPEGFAALPPAERSALLARLSAEEPAFLPGLVFQTYVAYYQDGRVLEALGLESRPPFPKGYAMEPTDLDLLEPVRSRPPLYRKP